MAQDDFGKEIGQEMSRVFTIAEASNLIDEMGLRAFLVNVKQNLEEPTERDNVDAILRQW
jgi:hypothetical protein